MEPEIINIPESDGPITHINDRASEILNYCQYGFEPSTNTTQMELGRKGTIARSKGGWYRGKGRLIRGMNKVVRERERIGWLRKGKW